MLTALVVLQSISLAFVMGTYGAISTMSKSFVKFIESLRIIATREATREPRMDMPWPEREN